MQQVHGFLGVLKTSELNESLTLALTVVVHQKFALVNAITLSLDKFFELLLTNIVGEVIDEASQVSTLTSLTLRLVGSTLVRLLLGVRVTLRIALSILVGRLVALRVLWSRVG
jgi:hypothetical protein